MGRRFVVILAALSIVMLGAPGARASTTQATAKTMTLHVVVNGTPPSWMTSITAVIECPAASGDANNVKTVDFDSHTGAPLSPGSEVLSFWASSCEMTQLWLSNPDWFFVTTCDSLPSTWTCTPGAEDTPGVVPYVIVQTSAEDGNVDVTYTNTFTSTDSTSSDASTPDPNAAEAVTATPTFTG